MIGTFFEAGHGAVAASFKRLKEAGGATTRLADDATTPATTIFLGWLVLPSRCTNGRGGRAARVANPTLQPLLAELLGEDGGDETGADTAGEREKRVKWPKKRWRCTKGVDEHSSIFRFVGMPG